MGELLVLNERHSALASSCRKSTVESLRQEIDQVTWCSAEQKAFGGLLKPMLRTSRILWSASGALDRAQFRTWFVHRNLVAISNFNPELHYRLIVTTLLTDMSAIMLEGFIAHYLRVRISQIDGVIF